MPPKRRSAPDDPSLPRFDGPRFASWLRRYRDAERLEWTTIAQRSGIHYSTLMSLVRGQVQGSQHSTDPSATTLARLAHGLGLDFTYIAAKAGLLGDGEAPRHSAYNDREREALLTGLSGLPGTTLIVRLRNELRGSLPNNHREDR